MPRYIRNTVILAKVESPVGTDASPTGAADAVLVSDLTINPLAAQNVDRSLVREYFGASEQLVGPATVRCSFTVELAGSGTAATPPQWGDLLLACGMAENIYTLPDRVEYTPISTSLKSVTIYWFDDGVRHKLLGAMGNVRIEARVGDRPKLLFDFVGVDGGIAAATPSGVSYAAWKTPVAMTDANVVDLTVGATYSAGALSGGTVYASTGFDIDLGNSVQFVPTLNYENIDITDRTTTGSVQLDLTAANEVSFMAVVKANTLQSYNMTIGTVAGNKIIVRLVTAQILNPTKTEVNGRRMLTYQIRALPYGGNDEIRIVTQ
jgi:hypothetical protein